MNSDQRQKIDEKFVPKLFDLVTRNVFKMSTNVTPNFRALNRLSRDPKRKIFVIRKL